MSKYEVWNEYLNKLIRNRDNMPFNLYHQLFQHITWTMIFIIYDNDCRWKTLPLPARPKLFVPHNPTSEEMIFYKDAMLNCSIDYLILYNKWVKNPKYTYSNVVHLNLVPHCSGYLS